MLADPLSVQLSPPSALTLGASTNFPCSERAADHSTYRFTDADKNDYTFRVLHLFGKTRNRYTMRLDMAGLTNNPLTPSDKQTFSQSMYVVFDGPSYGIVDSTATISNIGRSMCSVLGGKLVAVAGTDSDFLSKIIRNGET